MGSPKGDVNFPRIVERVTTATQMTPPPVLFLFSTCCLPRPFQLVMENEEWFLAKASA